MPNSNTNIASTDEKQVLVKEKNEKYDLYTVIIARLIRTKEFQNILSKLIPEIINFWAGKNPIKQMLSSPFVRIISDGFKTAEKEALMQSLAELAEDPDFSGKELVSRIPDIINLIVSSLNTAGKSVYNMPTSDEEEIIGGLLAKFDFEKLGNAVSSWVKIVNKIHEHNPTFYADNLDSSIHNFIEQVDFGEIKDFFDAAATDYLALIKRFNDVMWDFPAKVVILCSYIPSLINIGTSIISHSVSRFNRVPPDLVTDIILSLIREVNVKTMIELYNEVSEILRKLHTGSALIGEPGSPLIPIEINKIINEFIKNIDVSAHKKARVACLSIRESISDSYIEALSQNTQVLMAEFRISLDELNLKIRKANKKISLIDELSDDDLSETLGYGFQELEISELADSINQICLLINRIHELKPDFIPDIVSQFINSLDIDSISDTKDMLIKEVSEVIKPISRALLPGLITEFCSWFDECDDGYDEEMDRAKKALVSLFRP